jgi:hypothetical protein
MDNWFMCIDKALEKSNMERKDIDFLKWTHKSRCLKKGRLLFFVFSSFIVIKYHPFMD